METKVERRKILNDLLDAVKQCLIRFGSRTELATEMDKRVSTLCSAFEAVFSHGLKQNRNILRSTKDLALKGLPKSLKKSHSSRSSVSEDINFWHVIRLFLTKHEYERYTLLKHVRTDVGRGKAWLRSCLNENSLVRYLLTILEDANSRPLLNQYYEDEALFHDPEAATLLPKLARDLQSILFAVNIDNPQLDSGFDPVSDEPFKSEPMPVLPSPAPNVDMKSKKIMNPRIISLPDDDPCDSDNLSVDSAQSAPITGAGDSSPDPDAVIGTVEVDQQESGGRDLGLRLLLTPFDETSPGISSSEILSGSVASDGGKWGFRNQKEDEVQKLKDENHMMREELKSFKMTSEEKLRNSESIIESLRKENDILKVQLKKYISAIQMLKSEGNSDHNHATTPSSENLPTPKESITNNDQFNYYHEANEYEKKLVQVAEMHGELVEFNDRLHKVIVQKESMIQRLRQELVELRGPLPEGVEVSEADNLSVMSDLSSIQSIPSSLTRPLVNIWIPTAFLAGHKSSSSHHVYQIYVRIKDEEWNVYRRYSQFYNLNKVLVKKYPLMASFDFPPKKTFSNRDARVVQERRKRLEHYLRCVVNNIQMEHSITDKRSLLINIPFLGDIKSFHQKSDARSRSTSNLSNADTTHLSTTASPQYLGL